MAGNPVAARKDFPDQERKIPRNPEISEVFQPAQEVFSQ
jgi:hypothetical protein